MNVARWLLSALRSFQGVLSTREAVRLSPLDLPDYAAPLLLVLMFGACAYSRSRGGRSARGGGGQISRSLHRSGPPSSLQCKVSLSRPLPEEWAMIGRLHKSFTASHSISTPRTPRARPPYPQPLPTGRESFMQTSPNLSQVLWACLILSFFLLLLWPHNLEFNTAASRGCYCLRQE